MTEEVFDRRAKRCKRDYGSFCSVSPKKKVIIEIEDLTYTTFVKLLQINSQRHMECCVYSKNRDSIVWWLLVQRSASCKPRVNVFLLSRVQIGSEEGTVAYIGLHKGRSQIRDGHMPYDPESRIETKWSNISLDLNQIKKNYEYQL